MVAPRVIFPEAIDVIMPIIDGWTPITPADLNTYGAVLRRVEEVLGAGPNIQFTAPFTYGPKGANTSLQERIDAFLEVNGRPKDVAIVTGGGRLGDFSEDTVGKFVGFGTTLSIAGDGTDAYVILFDCQVTGTDEEGGIDVPKMNVPVLWWVNQKITTGCWIQARQQDGNKIDQSDGTQVQFCLLAFAYDSFGTG